MINQDIFDLLDDYLQGKLSKEDAQSLEIRLEQDPELREQLNLIKEANQLVMLEGLYDAEEKIKNWKPSDPNGNFFNKGLLFSFILLAVFSFSTFYIYSSFRNKPLENKVVIAEPKKAELKLPVTKDTVSAAVAEIIPSDQVPAQESDKKIKHVAKKRIVVNKPDTVIQKQDSATFLSVHNENKNDKTILLPVNKKEKRSDVNVKAAKCDSVFIKIEIATSKTCAGKAEGEIQVLHVSGGTEPYSYALKKGQFSNSPTFGKLRTGNYVVLVSDKNGCIAVDSTVYVDSEKCMEKEYAFAPESGQVFIYPMGDKNEGYIQIMNASGRVVHQAFIRNGDSWDGSDQNGNLLPSDSYFYIIKTNSGDLIEGYVTIVHK